MKILSADDCVPEFNLKLPEPGSESVVVVSKLYLKAAPPKLPS